MWKEGKFEIDGVKLKYEAKVFDEPSKFGIKRGRVSKLTISYDRSDDFTEKELEEMIALFGGEEKPILLYDRGWVEFPKCDFAMDALEYVLDLYK